MIPRSRLWLVHPEAKLSALWHAPSVIGSLPRCGRFQVDANTVIAFCGVAIAAEADDGLRGADRPDAEPAGEAGNDVLGNGQQLGAVVLELEPCLG